MLKTAQVTELLDAESLLVTAPDFDGNFANLAYDSNKVSADTLLFIKGRFKAEYLAQAIANGATALVVGPNFDLETDLPVWAVDDVMAAMSVLSMAFYGYPQNDLALMGITGTKGKSSTAYMAYEILSDATDNKVALSSTLQVITGNEPQYHYRANLTTPESLDLFRWMREAVDNGMTHMVMEVSSQAYKLERVYGLRFNVAVFLNISEDHIGANEHATFEEYLDCKLQLFDHAEQVVLNADTAFFAQAMERARDNMPQDGIWLYAREDEDDDAGADLTYAAVEEDLQGSLFAVTEATHKANELDLASDYRLNLPGDFNQGNAVAAMLASRLIGADQAAVKTGLERVQIPGRMQVMTSANHGTVYVDYAHNYASIAALLHFVKVNAADDGKVIAVVGAPGNKGESRRPGIGQAVNEGADVVYLTADDPQYEDPEAIADEIQAEIKRSDVTVIREMDRTAAIEQAIASAGPADVVVLAGKGLDEYQKINGENTPYENDWAIAQRVLGALEG